MSVTIKDVAAFAGVSFKTVSNVVNGRVVVREETRRKVLNAIDILGYRPHLAAQSLVTKRSRQLGFLVMQPAEVTYQDPFIAQITVGMHEMANQRGYGILVRSCQPEDYPVGAQLTDVFGLGQVDAVILANLPEELRGIPAGGPPTMPIVSLDEGDKDWQIPAVYNDNRADGRLATRHLLRLGRRRIGLILPTPLDRRPSLRRTEGYLDALHEYNITPDERLIIETFYTLQSAYDQTIRLLADGPIPDALFVADDRRALAVIEAIHERGLRIPEDIALVGHGDWMVGRYIRPSLTSVHHPFREMGRMAAQKALEMIDSDSQTPPGALISPNVKMPTYLVVRESCGAPPELRTQEGIRE